MNSRANDVVDDNDDKSLIWIESYRNIPNFRASSQYGTWGVFLISINNRLNLLVTLIAERSSKQERCR